MLARLVSSLSFLVAVGLGLSACSSSKASSDYAPMLREGKLVYAGSDPVHVLPNSTTTLTVRHVNSQDDGVQGTVVEFALLDPAPGSSVMPSLLVTDEQGSVSTTLRIGSEATVDATAPFDVRASAEGLEPIFIRVIVGDVKERDVPVKVLYAGARQISTRWVTRLPSTCAEAQASGVTGDPTFSFSDPNYEPTFSLAAGLHYALVGWGKDNCYAPVAWGCTELNGPWEVDGGAPPPVELTLEDLPMTVDGSYPLTLDLAVWPSLKHVVDALLTSASATLPDGPSTEGNFFLDAVEAELRTQGKGPAADAFHAARADGVRAAEIASALATAKQGALAYAKALGEALKTYGSRLELRTNYGVTPTKDVPMRVDVSMMRGRSKDGTLSLELSSLSEYAVPQASIDAAYSDTRAMLDIATLSVQLGVGTYGKLLLSGLKAGAMLDPRSTVGCEIVQDKLKDDAVAASCDETCVENACNTAIATLLSQAGVDIGALDTDHPNIGLRGSVFAHDRDGDGVVNELGPAKLSGNWGQAAGADAADLVAGAVPDPMFGCEAKP
jgi:hypothetical protein